MNGAHARTVVLGFDALSFDYLDAFDLPNFRALRERGVESTLRSTFPPWTGSAWPSMYTGVAPDHHGVYSFFDFTDGSPEDASVVTRDDVRAPAVWNYLTARDRSAVVLNVPVTHPAEPLDGVLVPGYLAPEDAAGYPEGIREELADELGEPYRIYHPDETGAADEETLEGLVDLVDLRRRAALALLDREDWSVALVQVQKTDAVFHKYDDEAAFRRVYAAADRLLGDVLDAVDDDVNVVVCSDHGIGPTTGYNVYVNEILRREGLVTATEDGTTPTLSRSKQELAGDGPDDDDASRATAVTSRAAGALEALGVEPGDVYDAADRVGLGDVLTRVVPAGASSAVSRHVDWSNSAAYCRSGPELGVRINLEGRDRGGVVPREEYEAVRDRVVEVLASTRTPDGDPAFDWVAPRAEVYDGPRAEAACDVLFQPAGMNHVVATNLLGTRFVPIDKYNHKRDGAFVAAGPGVDDGWSGGPLSLTDVAPTVMALAGCPVPERMTGSVPEGLLAVPADRSEYDVAFGTDEGDRDDGGSERATDDAVEARLEDLGYR